MQINFHYVFLVLRNLTFIKPFDWLIVKSLERIFRYSAKFYSMENTKAKSSREIASLMRAARMPPLGRYAPCVGNYIVSDRVISG